MDAPIRNLTRPSVARVCVLVDLLKDMPNRIWLGMGKFGRWQRIIYENPPKSCSFCRMRGHSLDECKARPVLNKGKEPLQDYTTNPNGAKEKAVAGQGETSKAAESVKPVTQTDQNKKSRTACDWEVFGCA